MELTYANDAEFGFLERDSRHLALDPLKPEQKAFAIMSPDGEGITLIGTPEELRDFAYRLHRFLHYGGASQPSQHLPIPPADGDE